MIMDLLGDNQFFDY